MLYRVSVLLLSPFIVSVLTEEPNCRRESARRAQVRAKARMRDRCAITPKMG